MSVQLLLNISEETYRKATQLADQQNSAVEQLLSDVIQERFEPFPLDDQHQAMQAEINAYQQLHPELVVAHLGQYVAIYQGKLVDYADNLDEIADRVDEQYPDEVVLVRQVQVKPERILHARSPRLLHLK